MQINNSRSFSTASKPLSISASLQLLETSTTSRELVEHCLSFISDAHGEGSRTFTRVYTEGSRKAADAIDARRHRGERLGPLAGIPISIKDLFDVAGEPTPAGSAILANAPSAQRDSTVVQRLKQADAILIGRTNMTEFAYSGLGLNPHYGTPLNPYDRATGRIPGGSSSGAAVSVSDRMSCAGVGSDTGGSVRIPAALCGLTGFKPTARRVPMDGVLPLSPSLDSIGPIAPTVDCCARVDAVLSGESFTPIAAPELSTLRIGVLQGYVLDSLDASVSNAFARSLSALQAADAVLETIHFAALERIPAANQLAATEAFAWHRDLISKERHRYDPHVLIRIAAGATMLAADYLDLLRQRREICRLAAETFGAFDAVLLPTTPWIAPPIAQIDNGDAAYFEANGAMLRNTSIFNYLDGCALSIPCHVHGEPPVGLMLAGVSGSDARVLRAGLAIESALQAALAS